MRPSRRSTQTPFEIGLLTAFKACAPRNRTTLPIVADAFVPARQPLFMLARRAGEVFTLHLDY
ncbi:hypothetical protein PSP6_320172 [Paraburkholderia tropica]|nr:hypothetical protein PSP6_320172 [Paraburkholderia tropica]